MYIDKLADIFNEYSNTYQRSIKMNHVDVNSGTYTDFGVENNDKDPKFEYGDHWKISKCKKISAIPKVYSPNQLEDVFVIINVKNVVPWTYVIEDLKVFGKP